MIILRKVLCLFGVHKYKEREIHAGEKPDKVCFVACIIQECVICGDRDITSEALPTTVVVYDKYQ